MAMRPAIPMKPPTPGGLAPPAPDKAALLAKQGVAMTTRPAPPPSPTTYPSGITRTVPPPSPTPGYTTPGPPPPPPGAAYAMPPARGRPQPQAAQATSALDWQGRRSPLAQPAPAQPMQEPEQ
jgi:hypothetical protein